MKRIKLATLLIVIVSLNFSCVTNTETNSTDTETNSTDTETNSTERSIGFTNWSDDGEVYKWYLGTDAAVDLVVDLDKVWEKQDYAKMRTFFADTAKFYKRDGKFFDNTTDFINEISSKDEEEATVWKLLSAYSVDFDPSRGGEHVQASFEVTNKAGDVIRELHEQYYIIDSKIVQWRQFSLPLK
jgi:hypothetical protein